MIYDKWGFSSPPFQTSSLPATALGQQLLVGRDLLVDALIRRISSYPKLATLEGLNGVGKTSIVNVATYTMLKVFLDSGTGPLYLPCRKSFQLDALQSVQDFIDEVYIEVAQTLIERAEEVKVHGYWLDTGPVNRWLNSPELTTFQGGAWLIQAGMQRQSNTGVGFERSGLRKAVESWLTTIFPETESGAVICTIDNLELLQTSEKARATLEQIRDELFNVRGIRWVLCGSLGIVHGVVSSPRLEGYLHKPIEVGEIGAIHTKDVLRSRSDAYAKVGCKTYLPIRAEPFEALYTILNGNTRSVLSSTDDYCVWISDRDEPTTDEDKARQFSTWLKQIAEAAHDAVRRDLRPKALEVFHKACELRVFSPSDYDLFGFKSSPAFRPHIKTLEEVGILVSAIDESDKRRKTIQVTPKGWIVRHHLENRLDERLQFSP